MPNKKKLFSLIFLIYVITRVATNLPAIQKPRELADTTAYLRISTEPIQSQKFWGDARPFVFPLLLKISQQDVSTAATLHLVFSILAWSFLALTVSAFFHTAHLDLFSFSIILALSLVRSLASWDYIMMTESLSVTFFVLFLALGIWLAQKWKIYKVILVIIAAFLLAFTRDTNAYLLLMLAGMLTLAIIFRWAKPRALILVASFLFIFLLNNYTSNLGGRWVFPLNNIIGKRILTDTAALGYFESCGMPVTPELLALEDSFANGQDRAFYESPALEGYRAWLFARGKSCYMKYLFSNLIRSFADALNQFDALIRFDKLNTFFARKYDPVIPYYFEPLVYPAKFILPLWILLTLAALFAVWKRAWNQNPLWGIYVLLCLPILPHLFITWHGDAMAPERHALSVGLQVALCFWLMIFLCIATFMSPLRKKTKWIKNQTLFKN
ncbi:MAG: hypothetical protein PHQ36_06195 [Anaerolineales bacterium]|nr:hypothetical protein [Anaerolineales bacterium]